MGSRLDLAPSISQSKILHRHLSHRSENIKDGLGTNGRAMSNRKAGGAVYKLDQNSHEVLLVADGPF